MKAMHYSFATEAEALAGKVRLEKRFTSVSAVWKHDRSYRCWCVTVIHYRTQVAEAN